jgi:3-oxoacyl-[acyl-carrier protein] reductase
MRQPRHGRAIAIALAEGGVDVAVSYKQNKSAADYVVSGDHEVLTAGIAIGADVADPKQVDLMTRAITSQDGEVNILVNCAGIERHERLDDVGLTTFDSAINVNLPPRF